MKRMIATTAAIAVGLVLVACSPQQENPSPATTADSSVTTTGAAGDTSSVDSTDAAAESDSSMSAEVTFADGFIRAKGTDKDMTAIFGTVVNSSDKDLPVTGFKTNLNAPVNEVHETVNGTMQKRTSPLVIKAGEQHEFVPGGDHFMIMNYPAEIHSGDDIDFSLVLSDGSTVDLGTVPVREVAAGNENYGANGELTGHAGMNH